VTARRPKKPVEELIKRADGLMNEVKHGGKNAIKIEQLPDG
jgi:PleD family two-component response regulator